ncbi:MAG: hypothetical protein ACFFAS_12350 [Promethearchaeota archaeon]
MKDCSKKKNNVNLNLLETDFKTFCEDYDVIYDHAKSVGIDKSKKILKKYFHKEKNYRFSDEELRDLFFIIDIRRDTTYFKQQDIMIKLLKSIKGRNPRKIKKILLLGVDLNCEFIRLTKIYTKARFCIIDFEEKLLNSFNKKYSKDYDFTIEILDLFSGRSLNDFTLKHGKFDLIIVSRLYSLSPSDKLRYASVKFVYKHLLAENGLLCILELKNTSEFYNPVILKKTKPMLNKIIKTKTTNNPIQFVIYGKNYPIETISQ